MTEISGPRTLEATRFEAFSDGVLAIAITLLILEIKAPEAESGQLWHELGRLWPSYATYGVSFLTIGVMWVNHHNFSARLTAIDHGVVYLNLLLLGSISFLPFPTALLSEYLRTGGSNERAAAGIYALTMVAISVAFTLMWSYIARHDQLVKRDRIGDLRRQATSAGLAALVYVGTFAISFVSAIAALAIFAIIAIGFAFNKLT